MMVFKEAIAVYSAYKEYICMGNFVNDHRMLFAA